MVHQSGRVRAQRTAELVVPFSEADIKQVGRLTQNGQLGADSDLVTSVRNMARDQWFDVHFEFQSTYELPLSERTATDIVVTLAAKVDESDRIPKPLMQLRDRIRLTAAAKYANAHVDALSLPEGVETDTATDVYRQLARTLREADDSELKLKSIRRFSDDIDESTGYDFGRAVGTTYSPDWGMAYLSRLHTPADADPVNTAVRDSYGLGQP